MSIMASNRVWTYRTDQELPARALAWYERDSNDLPSIIDFSTGYTISAQLINDTNEVVATLPNTNISKGATVPNVVLNWTTSFFNVPVGTYTVNVVANHTASGLDDIFDPSDPPVVEVIAVPTIP